MKDHIFELAPEEMYEDMIDHRSYTHNLSSCEIKTCITAMINHVFIQEILHAMFACIISLIE